MERSERSYANAARRYMEKHYLYWREPSVVTRFGSKNVTDFFRSEAYFLDQIAPSVRSVFDIGCASGRFIELFRHYTQEFTYAGLDLSLESIQNARRLYPDSRFFHGNSLDFSIPETFDLVNATGVCQHEPHFEELIQNMIQWSHRYVLFDVKLAAISDHLIDLKLAYRYDPPIYFIVLSLDRLKAFLQSQKALSKISVFGYATPRDNRTILPETIGELVSASVLLEKSSGPEGTDASIRLELPEWLMGDSRS